MIDVSIVIATWKPRELVLRCLAGVASSKRQDPALTRIEYHRSPYRFLLADRGRVRMAISFVLRIAKSLFHVPSQAPLARAEVRR